MRIYKKIITSLLIALAISFLNACSGDGDSNLDLQSNSYIINQGENRDIPIDAQILSVSTQDAQVKLTRDVESNITNIYVISGSVEVTELLQ